MLDRKIALADALPLDGEAAYPPSPTPSEPRRNCRACSMNSARSTGSAFTRWKRSACCIFFTHCFWKAGCQDKVSRSSAREALSASFPSNA